MRTRRDEPLTGSFLSLPPRSRKPRTSGITHVLDKGMPVVVLESLLDLAADHIDVIKFGWGTAYVSYPVRAKIAACRAAGVRVSPGGTLLEIAVAQGRVDDFVRWASALQFDAVEVSQGSITLDPLTVRQLISRLAREFVVLAEIGSKNPSAPIRSAEWVAQMSDALDAGASYVVAEGRESGTVGLYHPDHSPRADLVDALLAELPAERLIFESPTKDQQAWFVSHVGTEVNLGNVPPDEVVALETLRLGLRSDTLFLTVPDPDREPRRVPSPQPVRLPR